jgi:hypothetical protein
MQTPVVYHRIDQLQYIQFCMIIFKIEKTLISMIEDYHFNTNTRQYNYCAK